MYTGKLITNSIYLFLRKSCFPFFTFFIQLVVTPLPVAVFSFMKVTAWPRNSSYLNQNKPTPLFTSRIWLVSARGATQVNSKRIPWKEPVGVHSELTAVNTQKDHTASRLPHSCSFQRVCLLEIHYQATCRTKIFWRNTAHVSHEGSSLSFTQASVNTWLIIIHKRSHGRCQNCPRKCTWAVGLWTEVRQGHQAGCWSILPRGINDLKCKAKDQLPLWGHPALSQPDVMLVFPGFCSTYLSITKQYQTILKHLGALLEFVRLLGTQQNQEQPRQVIYTDYNQPSAIISFFVF